MLQLLAYQYIKLLVSLHKLFSELCDILWLREIQQMQMYLLERERERESEQSFLKIQLNRINRAI